MAAPAAWFPRHMAAPLVEALTDTPVVCLLGPRQCGKSTLARRAFPDRPYYSFDDDTLRDRAASDPRGFIPALAGSATLLLLPSVSESLAGRMEVVRLQPLTEAEKERKPGTLLEALVAGRLKGSIRPAKVVPSELIERVLRGGYPQAIHRARMARVRQWHRDYLRSEEHTSELQ